MTKELFVKELESKLNASIPTGYGIEVREIEKDGCNKTTIICRKPTATIAPVFYVDMLFKAYNNGESIESIIEYIIDESVSMKDDTADDLMANLSNKSYVLDNVVAVLVGENAKSRIDEQNCIYEPFNDMYIVYEIVVNVCGQQGTVRLTDSMLTACGATREEVIIFGKSNARENLGYVCTDLGELIGLGKGNTNMYVLTNKESYKGAYSVFYADLKGIADKLGANLVLLPSSIHEWIIVADDGRDVEDLKVMVKSVNGTMSKDEQLSDNVYYYNAETETFGLMK